MERRVEISAIDLCITHLLTISKELVGQNLMIVLVGGADMIRVSRYQKTRAFKSRIEPTRDFVIGSVR
jgi:hypothetical protein